MAAEAGTSARPSGGRSRCGDPLPHMVAHLLRAAVRAPSVHDAPPWRFRYVPAGGVIELHADPSLACSDPQARSVHIGCGAALFNLRLAAAWMGREPVARLLPRPGEPLLLATVRLGGAHRPTTGERQLYAAMPRRHISRQPFANRAVPGTVLAELAEAARIEGAVLHLLHPDEAHRVMRPGGGPARDIGAAHSAPGPDSRCAAHEREPRIAVLSTQFRARRDWLRAGQALQRVMLLATVRGVAAQPVSRPREVPEAWLARAPHGCIEQPQMLLLLGYGPAIPPVPHRPLSQVLDCP